MSDNLRRYRVIREALIQCYPGEPSGRLAQHLTTLAALISGIVGSKSSQLPSIATKMADRAKPESRVKRLARWLDNDHILEEIYFLPYRYWTAAMGRLPQYCQSGTSTDSPTRSSTGPHWY